MKKALFALALAMVTIPFGWTRVLAIDFSAPVHTYSGTTYDSADDNGDGTPAEQDGRVDYIYVYLDGALGVSEEIMDATLWTLDCINGTGTYSVTSVVGDLNDEGDLDGVSLFLEGAMAPDTGLVCEVSFDGEVFVEETNDGASPFANQTPDSELSTDGATMRFAFSEAMDADTLVDAIRLSDDAQPETVIPVEYEYTDDVSDHFLSITYPVVSADAEFTLEFLTDFKSVNGENVLKAIYNFNTLPEAGVTVTPITGNTTEAGGTATFTVVLDRAPESDVTIDVTSNNAAEGLVSTDLLTFTSENWNIAQTVTVTGQNDQVDDGDIRYTITLGDTESTDGNYDGESDITVITLENSDDDEPGAIDGGTVSAAPASNGGGGNGSRPRRTPTTSNPQAPSGSVLGTSDTSNGTFIRSDLSSTVYFVDSNNVRHPFIDKQTYFTYSNTFSDVTWVTAAELGAYTLGKPMLPKPGVVLVKIQSMNEVYAVQAGGSTTILRKITDEAMATSLYGNAWADYVIDVEPTHFTRFTLGTDMSVQTSTDLSSMKTRVYLNSK